MLHTHTDRQGRHVLRPWHRTPIGKLAITIGTVTLLALCLFYAADVMPVYCAGKYCAGLLVAP